VNKEEVAIVRESEEPKVVRVPVRPRPKEAVEVAVLWRAPLVV
jgi:hypothetical protein